MLLRQPCCKVKTDILLTGLAPVQKDIMMLERIRRRATKIISSKIRCLYRRFIYLFKAHTISNKLVSKLFAQKKGGKSYDSYKYVFKFWCPDAVEVFFFCELTLFM